MEDNTIYLFPNGFESISWRFRDRVLDSYKVDRTGSAWQPWLAGHPVRYFVSGNPELKTRQELTQLRDFWIQLDNRLNKHNYHRADYWEDILSKIEEAIDKESTLRFFIPPIYIGRIETDPRKITEDWIKTEPINIRFEFNG